jgi:ADP-heptose:LPS heptosyltransferase
MIVSLHRLGDTVFTIPAVREIQKYFGEKINIVCFPGSVPIYKLVFDEVNFCILQPDDFYLGGRMARSNARRKLKSLKPKIIFDITCSMVSASLIFNSRAKRIIGSNGYPFRAIYDEFVEARKSPHVMDIYLDAISPVIKLSDRNELKKRPKIINSSGRLLIQPFAGWKEKEWNLKKFINLAEKINNDYFVSLIIHSGQIGKDVLEEIAKSNIDIIQTTSVEELIDFIKGCSLFIGNDSGPVNIANFLGKPTLTLYGPTNPSYSATKTDHQIYIQKKIKCSAENDKQFCTIGAATYQCSGIQCMNLLTFDEVYGNVTPLIDKYCHKNNLV